jgi:FKBP-type peptidyl-prolyl cis-trans isomerase
MQVGGIRRLVVPSELGYGAQGAGGAIPPNAPLVFEIELLEISS